MDVGFLLLFERWIDVRMRRLIDIRNIEQYTVRLDVFTMLDSIVKTTRKYNQNTKQIQRQDVTSVQRQSNVTYLLGGHLHYIKWLG